MSTDQPIKTIEIMTEVGVRTAHNMPKANTTTRPHLCRGGRRRVWITGIGMRRMTMSVRTLDAATAYQNAVRLMQVPDTDLSYTLFMGVHSRPVAIIVETAKDMTNVNTPMHTRRNCGMRKILK